jgi:hypothetical protein
VKPFRVSYYAGGPRPRCINCGEVIPLERVMAAQTRKQTALYDNNRCANTYRQRELRNARKGTK